MDPPKQPPQEFTRQQPKKYKTKIPAQPSWQAICLNLTKKQVKLERKLRRSLPITFPAVAETGYGMRRPLLNALLAVALGHRRKGDRQWPVYNVANGPPPIAFPAVACGSDSPF